MKLIDLRMKPFGRFEDETILFDSSVHPIGGFYMVIGPNEAGKSTTLAAIERFLFGFPKNDVYNLTRSKQQWVGSTLQDHGGTFSLVWRKSSQKGSLFGNNQIDQLPDILLQEKIQPIDQSFYMKLFGLNQLSLRQIGESLVAGKGELADIIFGESLGDLHEFEQIRPTLKTLSDNLFKPKGGKKSTSPLNKILKERDELQSELEKVVTDSSTARNHETELETYKSEINNTTAVIQNTNARINLLNRQLQSIDLIKRLAQERKSLNDLGEMPGNSVDLSNRFTLLTGKLEVTLQNINSADNVIEDLNKSIADISIDDVILAHGEEIAQLSEDATRNDTAISQKLKLTKGLSESESDLLHSLENLGFNPHHPDLVPLIDVSQHNKIRAIGSSIIDLTDQIRTFEHDITKDNIQIESLKSNLEHQEDYYDLSQLNFVLEELQTLQEQWTTCSLKRNNRQELILERSQIIANLPLWKGDYNDFKALTLPEFRNVEQDELKLDLDSKALENAKSASRETAIRYEKRKKSLDRKIEQLKMPTLEEQAETRTLRDRLWSEIKTDWLGSRSKSVEDCTQLSLQFENLISTADQIAERLRDSAAIVSEMLSVEDLRSSHEEAESHLELAQKDYQETLAKWQSHFSFLDVAPTHPAVVKSWSTVNHEIQTLDSRIQSIDDELSQFNLKWTSFYSGHLQGTFNEFLDVTTSPATSFKILTELKSKYERSNSDRRSLISQIKQAEQRVQENSLSKDNKITELKNAEIRWEDLLRESGVNPEIKPSDFDDYLKDLKQWRKDWKSLQDRKSEITEIDNSIRIFNAKVHELAQKLEFPEDSESNATTVKNLNQKLQNERSQKSELRNLNIQIQKKEEERNELLSNRDTTLKELDSIYQTIGAVCQETAKAQFKKIQEYQEISQKIQQIESNLELLRESESLEDWIDKAGSKSNEEYNHDISQLAEKLEELREKRDSLLKLEATTSATLNEFKSRVTKATEIEIRNKQRLLFSKTEERMARYIKLRLTIRILEDATQEYKKKMGDNILSLASQNMKLLTSGSIDGLKIVPTDSGYNEIVALRSMEDPNSDQLRLDELSEGTRDQLFLALKLAMVQNRLEERAKSGLCPLPVILDDVLVQFDDNRSQAAFKLFNQLAQKTQVIFLTHHQHLEAVAIQALGGQKFGVHHLGLQTQPSAFSLTTS